MATLEEAAEELVVRLRGLDSEIEESEGRLEELRERIGTATGEVEQEWSSLREASSSLIGKARDEQQRLEQQGDATAGGVVDAQNAVGEDGAHAREELSEGGGHLDALAQHAAGLEPGIESLAADAGEEPARTLAERAHELEQELNRVMEETRDFLQDQVAGAAGEAADQFRQVCDTLHTSLAEATAQAFQQVYDDWESTVDKLEAYVVTEGYKTSHQHALDVVDYALEECGSACGQQIDEVQQLVGLLLAQLREMAGEVARAADRVVARTGAELLQELGRAHTSAAEAVAALDRVKRDLAQYSFVEV